MAKLIVTLDGSVVLEREIKGDRTTIGRRASNDIVLENRAVSGEHALIVRSGKDHILEDLNSTNGTFVNAQPIKKHFLQDKDIIELINYRIHYSKGQNEFLQASPSSGRSTDSNGLPQAVLKVLSGANAGKEVSLDKETTTLGRAGVHLAAVIRQPDGYFVRHLEGGRYTLLNGEPVGSDPYPLAPGDVIDLSGVRIGFQMAD